MLNRRHIVRVAVMSVLLPLLGSSFASSSASAAAPAIPPTPAPGSLGPIRGMTITAANPQEAAAAWVKYMGYTIVQQGKLSAATAKGWGAPAMAGKSFVSLAPESGEQTLLRFVEQATPEGFDPKASYGWNATEITVQNSDELYQRLQNSPFVTRRPPGFVPTYNYLKALGATGPAGERLNLTWITETRPDLAVAKSFVGRTFIAVQATPDLPAALKFFNETFGSISSPIRKLPSLELAVVPLGDGTKIEVDHHPGKVRERPAGGLPYGLAVVTFEAYDFAKLKGKFISEPVASDIGPHKGKRTATMMGPASELIELVDIEKK